MYGSRTSALMRVIGTVHANRRHLMACELPKSPLDVRPLGVALGRYRSSAKLFLGFPWPASLCYVSGEGCALNGLRTEAELRETTMRTAGRTAGRTAVR